MAIGLYVFAPALQEQSRERLEKDQQKKERLNGGEATSVEHAKKIDSSQGAPTSEQMFEVARPFQMADLSLVQAVKAGEDTAGAGAGNVEEKTAKLAGENGYIKPQGISIWSYLGFR